MIGRCFSRIVSGLLRLKPSPLELDVSQCIRVDETIILKEGKPIQVFKKAVQLVCVVESFLVGYGTFDHSEPISDQVVAKVTIFVLRAPRVELVCWVYGGNEFCDSRFNCFVALRGSSGDGRHV